MIFLSRNLKHWVKKEWSLANGMDIYVRENMGKKRKKLLLDMNVDVMLHNYLIEQSILFFLCKYWIFKAFFVNSLLQQKFCFIQAWNSTIHTTLVNWYQIENENWKAFHIFFRSQASRLCTDTTQVKSRNYTTVTVQEFETPSPTKSVIAKTKTRKDFATSDEETIPLCSPANTAGKHLKQH